MMNTIDDLKEDLQFLNDMIERKFDRCEILENEGRIEDAMRIRMQITELRSERIRVRSLIKELA